MSLVQEDLSDAQLIEHLRANDLDALGALFDRYYAQVYRTAAAITWRRRELLWIGSATRWACIPSAPSRKEKRPGF